MPPPILDITLGICTLISASLVSSNIFGKSSSRWTGIVVKVFGYVPISSSYSRYSTHSSTVLHMVLMRVSGRCAVLMALLTRAHKTVQYIVVLVQCMVLIVSISTCVQYTMRGLEGRVII